MHRLILLCLLLQIPWAYATTESATIYDHSAIQFLAHEKSDAWSQHEVATLQNFIETLPSALHPSSLIDDPSSPILVYKNHPAFASTHHSAAEPLNIQSDDSSSAAQTQQLLHYLLHRYEDINCASCSTEWREISGWRRGVLGLTYHAQNQDPRGYAAKAGLISPSEDFVTLAEHYLLPPTSTMEASIRCRTPQKYAYIKKQFADFQSPLERPEIACRKVDDGLLDDIVFYDPISHQPIEMGPINMETVKGFELLYATPGTGDASEIAGHLLLRIKLANNPQAELAGIENPHDLVISFLANTADTTANIPSNTAPEEKLQCKTNWLNIVDDGRNDFSAMHSIFQSLKGLSGGFLTMMNRQTLAEAIKSYTIEEERDLLRYELLLTKQQQYHLLQRLHLAKKNYNARYYFFNQNCASVLVTVIGQGINHQEIANFSPLVSPPNGLVGLFIRNGLARPVTPSIYSYRKRGFLAQEMIQSLYEDFPVATATDSRPAIEGLFSKRESTRLETAEALFQLADKSTEEPAKFYQLANLIQESEMAFDRKDLACEQYTSSVTASARRFQRQFREQHHTQLSDYSFNAKQAFNNHYVDRENSAYQQGTPHTKLFEYAVGVGEYRRQDIKRPIITLSAVMDAQEMGSISNIAMQRGNYVKLAAANLTLSLEEKTQGQIQSWGITALKIRKLKEHLDHIPSYFSTAGTIGMGLTLLDAQGDKSQAYRQTTLLGGELLFNLASTTHNNSFLYLAIGSEWVDHSEPSQNTTGIMLPLHLESLLTLGEQRAWQWRNRIHYRTSLDAKLNNQITISSSLAYRLPRSTKTQFLFKLAVDYHNSDNNQFHSSIQSWQTTQLAIEINHW